MTSNSLKRGTEMELMHEALARAHMNEREQEAHEERRAAVLARAQRLARRAERQALRARVLLARAV